MNWKDALQNYFEAHPTLNDENRAWLKDNVLLDIDLIREMPREQILTTFARKGKINNTLLIRTVVWQSMGLILAGQEDPLMGNLRSFWYKFADPIFNKNSLYAELSSRKDTGFKAFVDHLALEAPGPRNFWQASNLTSLIPSSGFIKPLLSLVIPSLLELETTRAKKSYIQDLCEDCLQDYVERRIFRYQGPFQFGNHNEGAGMVGSRASLLFFVEKQGLKKKYCDRYFKKYNISVLWSEGQPSLLMCEYFADQLRAKRVSRIAFGGLVDYDPAGYSIARTYRRHFETLGFETKGFTNLTTPAIFTERALEEDSEDIDRAHPSKKEMNDKWFAETNGITGKRRGIHVNHAMMSRVDKAVEDWYRQAIEL